MTKTSSFDCQTSQCKAPKWQAPIAFLYNITWHTMTFRIESYKCSTTLHFPPPTKELCHFGQPSPMLSIACPNCNKQFNQITPEMVGRKLRCPCGFAFRLKAKQKPASQSLPTPQKQARPAAQAPSPQASLPSAPQPVTPLPDSPAPLAVLTPLPDADFSSAPLIEFPETETPGLPAGLEEVAPELASPGPATTAGQQRSHYRRSLKGPIWTMVVSLLCLAMSILIMVMQWRLLFPPPRSFGVSRSLRNYLAALSEWSFLIANWSTLIGFGLLCVIVLICSATAVIEMMGRSRPQWVARTTTIYASIFLGVIITTSLLPCLSCAIGTWIPSHYWFQLRNSVPKAATFLAMTHIVYAVPPLGLLITECVRRRSSD